MPDRKKPQDKVQKIAAQAASAAGPVATRAGQLAEAAAAAAAPIAHRAKERAASVAEKAGAAGAKSVNAVAGGLDKATRGKFSRPISTVADKVEDTIHPDAITPTPRTAGPSATSR
jgi:hypothetical protein